MKKINKYIITDKKIDKILVVTQAGSRHISPNTNHIRIKARSVSVVKDRINSNIQKNKKSKVSFLKFCTDASLNIVTKFDHLKVNALIHTDSQTSLSQKTCF